VNTTNQPVTVTTATAADEHPICDHASPRPIHIVQVGFGFWGARALHSAVELGVFTELAQGPLDADALRVRVGLHPRGARDFFDALVALGMLHRTDGVYSNTPETDLFLDRAKSSYIGGQLEMASRIYSTWGSLTRALTTGEPQTAQDGGGFFEAIYADPVRLRGFLSGMTGASLLAAEPIAREFPWVNYRTFADIGTAQGCLPVVLSRAHPHLRGIGLDLPPVQPIFEEYVGSFDLSDRIGFQAADFFVDPLPAAEVLIMGQILQDWDLERKRLLIAKAYAALPEGGALIVYEPMIDDERRRNAFGLLMSLNMQVSLSGGFSATGAEIRAWLRDAGFQDTSLRHLVGTGSTGVWSMVVGVK
jgi:O-methyltransferase domain/Dimerisation domain